MWDRQRKGDARGMIYRVLKKVTDRQEVGESFIWGGMDAGGGHRSIASGVILEKGQLGGNSTNVK